ncbi:Putative GTP cyclohydrolase 1 type 2 [Polystyrenella longa]|uniref:GTP cyclohydrolase 1 type 2 homolog n=1 Tax=Polystyrenella longa TaxID=2528007 RepID=A0A518CUE7_9PLAN|nr:Nif3-like dinuclear metal center hexameric protein [Polystyrenella longa]QDU82860.1 Putative GTP cyclohydrolase 1 type 2 [Polystyrenella longa]
MTTVADLIAYFDELTPPELAESWDNVGLLIGRETATIQSMLTCLTLTPDVAAEAVKQNVDLVVSHHPILFRPVQQITTATVEGSMLLDLIESQIAVFSPHTRYDSAPSGINQQLAELLGLTHIEPLRPLEDQSVGPHSLAGAGRWGRLKTPVPFDEFVARVKELLNVPALSLSGASKEQIATVGIACGSAGEFLSDAARVGCDLFITGEARFHTAFEARELDIALLLAGHYQTERPAMELLAEKLQRKFPGVEVYSSQQEQDPFRWK